MSDETVSFEVGGIALGLDPVSNEWKPCEIVEKLDAGYKVRFEDAADNEFHVLEEDQISPMDDAEEEDDGFQVGDQLFGFSSEDGSWYPCEITEVCDNGYKVHFFDTPEDEIVFLNANEVIEEQVLPDGTPIFAFLEDTETWATGEIVSPTDDGYVVHLDSAPLNSTITLTDENIYPIDFVAGTAVLAWKESATNPANIEEGTWEKAILKGIIDTGYQVQFDGSREVCDLSPDRVRPLDDSIMEMDKA